MKSTDKEMFDQFSQNRMMKKVLKVTVNLQMMTCNFEAQNDCFRQIRILDFLCQKHQHKNVFVREASETVKLLPPTLKHDEKLHFLLFIEPVSFLRITSHE